MKRRSLIPALCLSFLVFMVQAADRLKVTVTTPDVESLAKELGGDLVEVFCFTKGPDDPHVVEILPSYVRRQRDSELLIKVGLGIEDGWLGDLNASARNSNIKKGAQGYLNLASGVRRLGAGDGPDAVEDSQHQEGNPHYLLDPVEGLKAAKLICDKYIELRPGNKKEFDRLHSDFVKAWAEVYFGKSKIAKLDLEALEDFESSEALEKEITKQSENAGPTDGIVGMISPYKGFSIVGDHDLWPYFARRFELNVIGYLEENPGVMPSTRHLGKLIGKMKEHEVKVILSAPYFDPRHSEFARKHTDAKVVEMSHQVAAQKETGDYLSMVRFNAEQLKKSLSATR